MADPIRMTSSSSSSCSFTIQCPCRNVVSSHQRGDARVYCPTCVHNALLTSLERHEQAKLKRDIRKEYCKSQLKQQDSNNHHTLSELEYESQVLRERLTSLRHECGSLAVTIASKVVENDERRAQQEDTGECREQLHRLNSSLNDSAMIQALVNSTNTVKQLRFRWALQVFRMYRLDVNDPSSEHSTTTATTRRHRIARGIGKCGGLPLPHAGPELYGVLPPLELQSCLRLVASLISTLARCLGINLPHPILLHPNGPTGDILDVATQTNTAQQGSSTVERKKSSSAATSMASSTSSLMSLMDATSAIKRSAKKALKRATGQQALQNAAHTAIPPSMEPSLVSLRLRHATAAVIAEDHHSSSSKYELSHSQMNDENFAIGLQLLQNDAVALCIRAGVPVANLWPAQAILLNLHALDNYCHEQVDDAIM